ncbi:MAG: hypothetical protein R2735_04260 [Microthrixaceae bacterium]
MTSILSPPKVIVRRASPFAPAMVTSMRGRLRSWQRSQTCCPPEAHESWTPSYDDLKLTYPHGVVPDDVSIAGDHERERRLGTD